MPIARSVIGRNLVSGLRGPAIGYHGIDTQFEGSGTSPSTLSGTTAASGSAFVMASLTLFSAATDPTDNKSNSYTQLQNGAYAGGLWVGYGMKVFGDCPATGGSSHTFSLAKAGGPTGESTLLVTEVTGASSIATSSLVARSAAGAGVSQSSASVTTTGPAMLLGYWSGDGDSGTHTFDFGDGFTKLDSAEFSGAYIQAGVGYKYVSSAGTYTFSVTPTQNEGGIFILVAVQ